MNKVTYEAEIILKGSNTFSACGHHHRTLSAALDCANRKDHGHTERVHVITPLGFIRNITASEWGGDLETTQKNIEEDCKGK